MLSIGVAANLNVDTRPVPPDTPGIAMAVVLAGITASAYVVRRWQQRRWTPDRVIQAMAVVFFGWPPWVHRDHYVDRAGACPAARRPRGMGAVRAPLAKGGIAVLIVVTAWRCRSISGFERWERRWERLLLGGALNRFGVLPCAPSNLRRWMSVEAAALRMHSWGSRGRRFKSGRPDNFSNTLGTALRRPLCPSWNWPASPAWPRILVRRRLGRGEPDV
jgi:hypothetical protein